MESLRKDNRLSLASWGLVCIFGLCVFSQAKVQTWDRDNILKLAKNTNRSTTSRTDFALRGRILSADGIVLAESDDTFSLSIDYRKVPHSSAFFLDLAAATGLPASELSQPAANGLRGRVWRNHFGSSQRTAVQDVKLRWRADGISINRILRRRYSLDSSASSIIGLVRNGTGVLGLESSQNTLLSGTDGKREGMIDRSGAFLPMRMEGTSIEKQDGRDIHLTIDSGLQIEATRAVRESVETNKADSGVAVVVEPMTGRVLAMATWPSFDPNSLRIPVGAERNDATMCVFEPGSTFKILTLAKALDSGAVQPNLRDKCTGTLNYNRSWRIRCDLHGGTRAHGSYDLEKAIAKSCNVAAAGWALKIGHRNFTQYMSDLGLLNSTRLGLPRETTGTYNQNEYAKPLQLMTFGFGQSLTATPVQLASAFAMIGNGGLRIEPTIIDLESKPTVSKQVVRKSVADEVLKLMESVIESDSGTGAKLRIPGYRLAGKTGTAQKVGSSKRGGHVSSFVGFVPARDPKALILVMVDNPKAGKIYGAQVAGPVFRSIAVEVIKRFQIPPTKSAPQVQQ